jgi:hypothetical protein
MGYIPADTRIGGRFDIDGEGKVSNPRFTVHRRMVDEVTGADMPQTDIRSVEVPADPAEFDALFSTSVASLDADNKARHEQVAVLINEKAAAVEAEQAAKRERDVATLAATKASEDRDVAIAAAAELADLKPGAKA